MFVTHAGACDGRVPSCSQCLHTGRSCGGYQYDLIFVGSNVPIKPKSSRRSPRNSSKPPDAPTTATATLAPGIPQQVNDVLSLVARSFIPAWPTTEESPARLRSSSRICGAWIEKVPELGTTGYHGKALQDSIKAFGSAIVSQGALGAASTADALDAHGVALSSIRCALRRRQTTGPNELSAAIMFLFLTEILLPQASSSRFHAAGLSQLMRAQGPSFYVSGISHDLFVGFRPSITVWSISARKSLFLGSHEWSTIPFQETPPDPLQSLMTIGTCISSELENIDDICENFEPSRAFDCIDFLKDIVMQLDNWKNSHIKNALPQESSHSDGKSLSTHDILYHDVTEANVLTHYWAFSIICAVQARSLHQYVADLRPLPLELEIPEVTLKSNATFIMQSVEYLARQEMKLYGAISLTLPLKVSHEYLERHGGPAEVALCRRVMENIDLKGHYYLRNFVSSDHKLLWPLRNAK
ncbi:N-terminal fungal transcription regulatory domain-containing protein [Cordyceps javanica]|uniref:N-terminal fungal transcription regulatory domain-containing protein n=1 Tax=Cordyceps javanica TaxID=43265 RepID=A0A545UQP9_9HYPO|nr:N-terminal fungal transcription regulatory domain-containing protein [Cordyceps javanica]TQW03735.1 N-terminal fungal transcription regulatory domain-containing protein [Cordyceps javanica]